MDLTALRRTGHAPSLVAALLHFDVSFMAWVLLGALGAYIGDDLGLSASAKGLMVAVPLLAAAFFRVLLGLLGDRYGPRRVGVFSMPFVVVALLLGWLAASSYGAVLGVGVLLGVAGSSFAISLIPVVLVWGAFALLAKEPPPPERPVRVSDLRAIARERDAWRLCGLYAVTFGSFVGLASFLPIFFHDQYGLSKVDAATIVAAGGALGSLLRPLGGVLADRH